jgi:hypothetical protein
MTAEDDLVIKRDAGLTALPLVVTVLRGHGAFTPGPCAVVECGNFIELTVEELAWLMEDAGPKALDRLRELAGSTSEAAGGVEDGPDQECPPTSPRPVSTTPAAKDGSHPDGQPSTDEAGGRGGPGLGKPSPAPADKLDDTKD